MCDNYSVKKIGSVETSSAEDYAWGMFWRIRAFDNDRAMGETSDIFGDSLQELKNQISSLGGQYVDSYRGFDNTGNDGWGVAQPHQQNSDRG